MAPHQQGCYVELGVPTDGVPIAARLAADVLSLPMGPQLSQDDALRISGFLKSAIIE